ncbi:helix-turn-helix domain-containing protein [Mycobacterium kansasii]
MASEPWLSAEEIAAHLGVTKDTVYVWIADKAMPAHKIGRLWKFQASEVDSWVRGGRTASNSPRPGPFTTTAAERSGRADG